MSRHPTAPTKAPLDKLVVWRSEPLEKMPYLSSIPCSTSGRLDTPGIGTCACDARYRPYIDFDTVTPECVAWCAGALLHECAHRYTDHAGWADEYGVEDADRLNGNLGGDAESNDDLVAEGCTTISGKEEQIAALLEELALIPIPVVPGHRGSR